MKKIKNRSISENLEKMVNPNISSRRSSLGFESKIKEFYMVDIKHVLPFKDQARKYFDDEEINNLANSIKQYGVRQPLTVIKSDCEKGFFEVISGERRLRAAKIAGLDSVPCIILERQESPEKIALIENMHRVDLHPIEFGDSLYSLLESGLFKSQNEIANSLSIKESKVSEYIKYSKIPPEQKKFLIENNIKSRQKIRDYLKEKGLNVGRFSVLRISKVNEEFKIEDAGIKKLNTEQRELLKQRLEMVVNNL